MRSVRHSQGLRVALGVCAVLAFAKVWAQTPPGEGKATVYVYRERLYDGSALKPSVYCNEVELARIQNGRYFRVRIEPGHHVFRASPQPPPVELEAKPGGVYYLRVELIPKWGRGQWRLVLLPREEDPYQIHDLEALDPGQVKDRTRVAAKGEIPDSPSLRDLVPSRPAPPAPITAAAPAAAAPAPAAPVAPPAPPSTAVVKSTPAGADILLDGKFMGSTPSSLRLPPGDHTLTIQKAGFKSWQRSMAVVPEGVVTIDATLEKNP